jgi:hypothetical protein
MNGRKMKNVVYKVNCFETLGGVRVCGISRKKCAIVMEKMAAFYILQGVWELLLPTQ